MISRSEFILKLDCFSILKYIPTLEPLDVITKKMSLTRLDLLENVCITKKFWCKTENNSVRDIIMKLFEKKSMKNVQIFLEKDITNLLELRNVGETSIFDKAFLKKSNIIIHKNQAQILQSRYVDN